MEFRTLELKISSAKDLKDVNLFSKMEVYAVVSLSGDPLHRQKFDTPVDKEGGRNPTWNFPINLTINESLARQNRLTLEIKLRCERVLSADKDVGRVHVPLKDLLDQPGDGKSFQHVSYQVRKPSGKPKGSFNFSYKFGENKLSAPVTTPPLHKAEEPVIAHPAPPVGSTSSAYAAPYPAAYPPPPPQYAAGYGYPPTAPPYGGYPQPHTGYGYPGQPGYGYPPTGQGPAKNKFGMGLGAGLLGGALGGLLIGDMISDAGAYDDGYDAGFGDAGGGFGF